MRLVVDVNLMIRALRSPGPARRFFSLGPLQHQILYHDEQIAELQDVASRPRLAIDPLATQELIDRLKRYGELSQAQLETVQDCRDPKDNYLLSIALAGRAEVILSEDQDLLVLDPWRGVRIMRLVRFLEQLPLRELPAS